MAVVVVTTIYTLLLLAVLFDERSGFRAVSDDQMEE